MTIGKRLLLAVLFVAAVVLAIEPLAFAYEVEADLGVVYTQPNGSALKLDVYRPMGVEGRTPVILALHGGAWMGGNRADVREMSNYLASQGYAVVSADYRLAPLYSYPAQLEDVKAAARWISANADEYSFNRNCLIMYGESAGAHLASLYAVREIATYPKPIAVVDLFGPTDFTVDEASPEAEEIVRAFIGVSREVYPELYEEASPITHVNAGDPPFFIAHDPEDPLVPYSQSTSFAEALRRANVPVTLYQMQGVGHKVPAADTEEGARFREALTAFLKSQVSARCTANEQQESPGG